MLYCSVLRFYFLTVFSLYNNYRQITQLYSNPAATDFLYISGVATIPQYSTDAIVTVSTIDDNVPEDTKNYTLDLVSVSGMATLDSETPLLITGNYSECIYMNTKCMVYVLLYYFKLGVISSLVNVYKYWYLYW